MLTADAEIGYVGFMTNPLTSVQVGSTVALGTEPPAQIYRTSLDEWQVQRLMDGVWVDTAIIEHHANSDVPWDIYPPEGTRSEDGEDKHDEQAALDTALDFHVG